MGSTHEAELVLKGFCFETKYTTPVIFFLLPEDSHWIEMSTITEMYMLKYVNKKGKSNRYPVELKQTLVLAGGFRFWEKFKADSVTWLELLRPLHESEAISGFRL